MEENNNDFNFLNEPLVEGKMAKERTSHESVPTVHSTGSLKRTTSLDNLVCLLEIKSEMKKRQAEKDKYKEIKTLNVKSVHQN